MKRFVKACLFVGVLATSTAALPQVAGTLPETPDSSIGYETVAMALKAVQAKPEIETRVENDWLVVIDNAAKTICTFAPKGHPAYPTAVKRTVVPINERSNIEITILCESDKVSCDTVVLQVQELTNRVLESLK